MDTVFRLMDGALRLPEAERGNWIARNAPGEEARSEALAMLAFVTTEPAPGATGAASRDRRLTTRWTQTSAAIS